MLDEGRLVAVTVYWEPGDLHGPDLSTSYLPCPANPFPDTEVHKDPCDGQRYCQWHSDLAWFFQALGHFMHVAPASQSQQQQDHYTHTHARTHRATCERAAEEALVYVSQGCMQDTLKLCCV